MSARDKSILDIQHIAKTLVSQGCWPRYEQFPTMDTVTAMLSGCLCLSMIPLLLIWNESLSCWT